MSKKNAKIRLPRIWGMSKIQSRVIRTLANNPGYYTSAYEFCQIIYPRDAEPGMPAPAKLRVLIMECRDMLHDLTDGEIVIDSKRGSGWYMTQETVDALRNIVDPK